MNRHQLLHPGEHIRDILIDGAGLNMTEAAKRLGVTRSAIARLINCHTDISPEYAKLIYTFDYLFQKIYLPLKSLFFVLFNQFRYGFYNSIYKLINNQRIIAALD